MSILVKYLDTNYFTVLDNYDFISLKFSHLEDFNKLESGRRDKELKKSTTISSKNVKSFHIMPESGTWEDSLEIEANNFELTNSITYNKSDHKYMYYCMSFLPNSTYILKHLEKVNTEFGNNDKYIMWFDEAYAQAFCSLLKLRINLYYKKKNKCENLQAKPMMYFDNSLRANAYVKTTNFAIEQEVRLEALCEHYTKSGEIITMPKMDWMNFGEIKE